MPSESPRAPAVQAVDGYQLQAAGYEWDALRVPTTMGVSALAALGMSSGAVIEDPREGALYWFVPPGATAGWHLPGTRPLSRTHHLVVPVRSRAMGPGPRWHIRPENGLLTDPAALRSALEMACGIGHDGRTGTP